MMKKRFRITPLLVLVVAIAGVLLVSVEYPQAEQKKYMRAPKEKVRPRQLPEPTGVYGWLGLVDPATNRRWAPISANTNRLLGYPMYIRVRFQERTASGSIASVELRSGAGVDQSTVREKAFYYGIVFRHNTAMRRPPELLGNDVISYNPHRWAFVDVQVGEYRYRDREYESSSRIRILWSVPFERRRSPFRDLPNRLPDSR